MNVFIIYNIYRFIKHLSLYLMKCIVFFTKNVLPIFTYYLSIHPSIPPSNHLSILPGMLSYREKLLL